MTADRAATTSAFRRLLRPVLRVWGKQEALAAALGVARTAVANWLAGDRLPDLQTLHVLLLETARQDPAAVPGLVELLAEELLDAHGTWRPEVEDATPARSLLEESADVTEAHAALLVAIRDRRALELDRAAGRPVLPTAFAASDDAIRRRVDELVRETRELAEVATRATAVRP